LRKPALISAALGGTRDSRRVRAHLLLTDGFVKLGGFALEAGHGVGFGGAAAVIVIRDNITIFRRSTGPWRHLSPRKSIVAALSNPAAKWPDAPAFLAANHANDSGGLGRANGAT
jgi:hypothetical protein